MISINAQLGYRVTYSKLPWNRKNEGDDKVYCGYEIGTFDCGPWHPFIIVSTAYNNPVDAEAGAWLELEKTRRVMKKRQEAYNRRILDKIYGTNLSGMTDDGPGAA